MGNYSMMAVATTLGIKATHCLPNAQFAMLLYAGVFNYGSPLCRQLKV
ncbi:MAG: hypothetical protein ACRAVC_16090 [Trichormus sp.]